MIRLAKIDDMGAIITLLREMHNQLQVFKTPVDDVAASETILRIINTGLCLVSVENEEIVGALGAQESSNWWSSSKYNYIEDLFFFVREDARRSLHAVRLMKALIEYADKLGMPLAVGHQLSQKDRQETKDRFYTNLGFEKVGSIFVMEK